MNSSKKIFRLLFFFVALFVAMPVLAQDFNFGETLRNFGDETGFAQMFATEGGWKTLIMLVISCVLVVYIGILYLQSHYIFTSDYGFAKDEVLYVPLNKELQETITSQELNLPDVTVPVALSKETVFAQAGLDASD